MPFRWPTPALCLAVALASGGAGCAQHDEVEPSPRGRMNEILSPTGATYGDAHSKRSRYDGKDFQSKELKTKAYTSGKRRWEGRQAFASKAYQKPTPLAERSRFEQQESTYGDDKARTFASRFEGQAARTKDYAQADTNFRTGAYRESEAAYVAGEKRYHGPVARTLKPTQLSRTAIETQNAYSPGKGTDLDEEAVRRVLNKGPKPD